jgi:hypothetical protein
VTTNRAVPLRPQARGVVMERTHAVEMDRIGSPFGRSPVAHVIGV